VIARVRGFEVEEIEFALPMQSLQIEGEKSSGG